jgi:hypothetical protein
MRYDIAPLYSSQKAISIGSFSGSGATPPLYLEVRTYLDIMHYSSKINALLLFLTLMLMLPRVKQQLRESSRSLGKTPKFWITLNFVPDPENLTLQLLLNPQEENAYSKLS